MYGMYGFAHSQPPQAFFDLMRCVIDPLSQHLQPIKTILLYSFVQLFNKYFNNLNTFKMY